jgi:hypothetical protein
MIGWQGQQGSNPRPAVLETAALPTELYPYRGVSISQEGGEFKSIRENRHGMGPAIEIPAHGGVTLCCLLGQCIGRKRGVSG